MWRNPYGDQTVFHKELRAKKRLEDHETVLTQPFYRKLAREQNIGVQIYEELPVGTDMNLIRNAVSIELGKYIRGSQEIANIIDRLNSDDDLLNYYRFGKLFEKTIQGVRQLDASYFIQLWEKFKENLLEKTKSITQETTPDDLQSLFSETTTIRDINKPIIGKTEKKQTLTRSEINEATSAGEVKRIANQMGFKISHPTNNIGALKKELRLKAENEGRYIT